MKGSTALIAALFALTSMSMAQEQLPMPDMTPEETVRMQVQNIMMKDTMIITLPYHADITFYHFPDKVLAEGLDAAKKYWVDYAKGDEHVDYEFLSGEMVDDIFFARLMKVDHSQGGMQKYTYMLFQFEGKRIKAIYFF